MPIDLFPPLFWLLCLFLLLSLFWLLFVLTLDGEKNTAHHRPRSAAALLSSLLKANERAESCCAAARGGGALCPSLWDRGALPRRLPKALAAPASPAARTGARWAVSLGSRPRAVRQGSHLLRVRSPQPSQSNSPSGALGARPLFCSQNSTVPSTKPAAISHLILLPGPGDSAPQGTQAAQHLRAFLCFIAFPAVLVSETRPKPS